MIRARCRRSGLGDRGSTLVEFALLLPVLMVLIMGLAELAYQGYVFSVLDGAVQKAGRDSAIQGNNSNTATTAIDNKVKAMVLTVAKNASFAQDRKFYPTFGTVKPEYYRDDNQNDQYDKPTECFTDINGNGVWDKDPGLGGQGGADDVVVYTMTVTYPRLFPVAALLNLGSTATMSASTTLKNQPYEDQKKFTAKEVCPK